MFFVGILVLTYVSIYSIIEKEPNLIGGSMSEQVRILLTIVAVVRREYRSVVTDEHSRCSMIFELHSSSSSQGIIETVDDYITALTPRNGTVVSVSYCVLPGSGSTGSIPPVYSRRNQE